MNDEPKVWVSAHKTKGKTTYHLRWICPQARAWKSRKSGTDKRQAEREALRLEEELAEGTHRATKRIGWDAFLQAHVDNLDGDRDREQAEAVIRGFKAACDPRSPRHVTYAMLSEYVRVLRDRGNAVATRNKAMRYMRRLLRWGVRHDFIARTPFDTGLIRKEDEPEKRVIASDEQLALLAAADGLYGFKLWAFLRFLLISWARFGEAVKLEWQDVNFKDGSVYFRATKSHTDR